MGLKLKFKDPQQEAAYLVSFHDENSRTGFVAAIVGLVGVVAFVLFDHLFKLNPVIRPLQIKAMFWFVPITTSLVFISRLKDPYRRIGGYLLLPLFIGMGFFEIAAFRVSQEAGTFRVLGLALTHLISIGAYVLVPERALRSICYYLPFSLIVVVGVHRLGLLDSGNFTFFVAQAIVANMVGIAAAYMREYRNRRIFDLNDRMNVEKKRSDDLVAAMLPQVAADRLKAHGSAFADTYPDATVLFADLVGFSKFAAGRHPQELIRVLTLLFGAFDAVLAKVGGECIKTIGDSYMVAVGCPTPVTDHATVAAQVALGIRDAARTIFKDEGLPLDIRIGMHSGVLVGGVLSPIKPAFDVWGDTVNIAARLEGAASPGTILVSESAWEAMRGGFAFGGKSTRELKGVGNVTSLELKGAA